MCCGTPNRIANSAPTTSSDLDADRLTRYHTRRLAALGYAVTLTKRAA
jgi:hypothetical protein